MPFDGAKNDKEADMRKNIMRGATGFLLLLLLALAAAACSKENRIELLRYQRKVEEQRAAKDKYFRERSTSPLIPEQIGAFTGLKYFPIDSTYKVRARLVKAVDGTPLTMQESNGSARSYIRKGKLEFELAGKPYSLMAYQESGQQRPPGEREVLFIPFTDLSSGEESYGAGRYLEPEAPSDEVVLLDFNLAYNPYCAYNNRWSCPIPPAENKLAVKILSGEKSYR